MSTFAVTKEPSEKTRAYMAKVLNRFEAHKTGCVIGDRPRDIAECLGFREGEFNKVYKALWYLVKEGALGFHRPRQESRLMGDGDRPFTYRLLPKVR